MSKINVAVTAPDRRKCAEQARAAREASQPAGGWRNGRAAYAKPSTPNHKGPIADPTVGN